jgi:hypothetical protein
MKDLKLDLTADETLTYVIYSIQIIEPVLTDAGMLHPAWRCWLYHRQVVIKCMQHVYKQGDDTLLRKLLETWDAAFDKVAEYTGLKRPKAHFAMHLPKALRNYGPFRQFWCMPWEGFLQVCHRPAPPGPTLTSTTDPNY